MSLKYKWIEWLKGEYDVSFPNNEPEYIPVHIWVKSLVTNGIIPILVKSGYSFKYSTDIIISKFLNFIYQFDNGRRRRYTNSFTDDDQEFFHSFKCTFERWKKLKKEFYIEHFADDGDFAEKLWLELPNYIFELINIDKSHATEELNQKLAWEDEEESDNEKKNIDPYLIEHSKY